MNFLITMFNADSIIAGFRAAKWSPDNFPVGQFRKVLSTVPDDVLIRLFVDVMRIIYREDIPSEARCMVTAYLLDLVAARPRLEAELQALKKLINSLFGLNVVGASQFQTCFDRWIDRKREPLIIVAN